MYNLPNMLTISRIAVIPLIFLSVYCSWPWYGYFAAILFIAASITDYFDGYLARLYNQTSAFGRLLDPIADKLLVASALVVILIKPDMITCKLSYVPVFVILCREILVSGLREFLREVNVGMPVTRLAKWKTGFQMTALAMMLLRGFWYWGGVGEILLWVAGVLTFITGYQYFEKSLEYIKSLEKAKKAEKKTTAEAAAKKTVKKTAKAAAKKTPVKKEAAKKAAKKPAAKKSASAKKAAKKPAAKKSTTKKESAK